MEGGGSQPDATAEFVATGRTGRRNAVPDITNKGGNTSTADLPDAMSKLSCTGRYSATNIPVYQYRYSATNIPVY